MDAEQLRNNLRANLNLSVGEQVAAYVLSTMSATPAARIIPVLAQDARTGAPVRRDLTHSDVSNVLGDAGAP